MSSYSPPNPRYSHSLNAPLENLAQSLWPQQMWFFLASAFLVSVPVFVQAPLVRLFPWLSLLMTLLWVGLSLRLQRYPALSIWGDLLWGFSWTWAAGALYWGWLRWEPLLHLPIEAIGLPFAIIALRQGQHKIGNWFYLGSLFGTVVTDVYFYLVNLIPAWRQLMQTEASLAPAVLQSAIAQIQTPWGINCAVVLVGLLITVGMIPLRSTRIQGWAFSGAVLSTLLVDGLFWIGATLV